MLQSPSARIAPVFRRPIWLGLGLLGVLCVAGWAFLAVMVAAMAQAMDTSELGPGMALFNALGGFLDLSEGDQALLAAICRVGMEGPFGLVMPGEGGWKPAQSVSVLLMWGAMIGAMMLPSAAPMITTYCEIAETAEGRSMTVPSPVLLIAGYIAVWLGAAFVFACLQAGASMLGWLSGVAMAPTSLWFAAAILTAAGGYQFSSVRHACVVKCRNPFNYFFSNWTDRPIGVFRHGVRQGLWCVGCCVGLMLVMFAVGLMNILWMALLGALMIVEKLAGGKMIGHLTGTLLILAGFLTAAAAF